MRIQALLEGSDLLREEQESYMVALPVPAAAAAALALPGGEPAERLHITLAVLPGAQPLPAVARALRRLRLPRLRGTVGGLGRFLPKPSSPVLEPLVVTPDVPGLAQLRAQVVRALRGAGAEISTRHDFVPHITLAYLKPGTPWPALPPRLSLDLGELQLVQRARVLLRVPLGKVTPLAGSVS